jgi:exopolysaccharide biosynthesis polyprenyl glycosylphosphotransferase
MRSLSLFCLLGLVTLGFWGWLLIWEQSLVFEPGKLGPYFLYNEFLLIGILFGSSVKRRSDGPHHRFIEAVRLSGRQTMTGLFAVVIMVFALRDIGVSRSFLFSFVPWLYMTLLFSNYFVPKWLGQLAFSGDREERVALAGTLEQASLFKPWLERKRSLGLHTVGVVHSLPNGANGNHTNGSPFPVLGNFEEIETILQQAAITQLIVLDMTIGPDRLRRLAQLCEGAAVRLLALHDLNSYFNHTTTTFEDDGMRFIGLREEPLESPVNRFVKRMMDIIVASLVIAVVLLPATILVWLIHRFQSPGPIFFTQARVGMMGRPFKMYKFRTMHANNENEARQASKHDARIFPAGRWLRKLSIDELPQFINVLLGTMSVVGPRPHLETHEDIWTRVMQRYVVRRFIRPGMTGWAQINGFRGEIHTEADIQHRVEADIHYLENWSASLDCVIILKTAKQCLFPPRSAY